MISEKQKRWKIGKRISIESFVEPILSLNKRAIEFNSKAPIFILGGEAKVKSRYNPFDESIATWVGSSYLFY